MEISSLPSADLQFPAQAQQAQVDAVNGKTPNPPAPKPNAQHEPMPDTKAAQMLPAAPPAREPAASPAPPVAEVPPKFEDTEEVAPKFEDTDPVEKTPAFEDTGPADNTAMRKYVEGNLQVYNAALQEKQPDQKEASSFFEALKAGWQMSTLDLSLRGKMPDTVLPENAPRAYRIASQIASLAGDVPAMVEGGILGGVGGGLVGTEGLPVIGTIGGAVIGGTAGAFAFPAALRKIMVDHYEKGDIQTSGEFFDRLLATSWEAIKGAATGAATAVTGGTAGALAGPMVRIGAELATMTTVGAALEGHAPHAQDFIDGAIVIGGLHGAGLVAGKLRNIYARTGERPELIVAESNSNPELKQKLLSPDKESPEQASPTEIKSTKNKVPAEEFEKTGETLLHGTNADFTDFAHTGTGVFSNVKKAYYFTDVPAVAKKYVDESDANQKIISTKVYGETLDLTDKKNWPADLVKALEESDDRHDKALLEDYKSDKPLDPENFYAYERSPALRDYADKNGIGKIKQPDIHEGEGLPKYSYLVPDSRYIEYGNNKPAEHFAQAQETETQSNQLVKQDMNINPPEPAKVERSPEEQEILSKIGEAAEPAKSSFRQKFAAFYARTVDWTDPLKAAYAAFKQKTGIVLGAEENPHILARLFAGHIDFLRRVLNEGIPDADGVFSGKGLNDIYARVPDDDQAGFDAYSMARRAIELDDRGIVPWSDFNRENAEKVVADGKDKYEALHRERVQVLNDVIDYGVRKGVISKDMAEAVKSESKEYIPFNRIIPQDELTGQGEIGNGKLLNKIEGSELDIKNPRIAIYQNIASIIRRAEINDIRMKTLENLSYDTEDGKQNDFVREVPLEGALKKGQVAIFRDGKMSALEPVGEGSLVIDSLKRLEGDRTMADMVTKIAAGFAKSVRVGQIVDPGFAFRHFFRSTIMSGVYSRTGQIPFFHPAMALSEYMAGSSEMYKDWLSNGGATQSYDKIVTDYVDNDLEGADQKYPFLDKAWNVIKKPFEAAEMFIKQTDNLVGFTEYKRSIEKGYSKKEAAFNAREVKPDFAKVGLERSAIRTMVAFQGAHINSLDRMVQAFREDAPGTMLRMAALTGISTALWYANKDDQEVSDLPEYKKDLYWNVNVSRMFDSSYEKNVTPEGQHTGTIFSFPKPWAPGILFGSGMERTLDAFFKHNPDAYKGFGRTMLDSVLPNVVPSVAAPILDQMANKNLFSGRQLVNDQQQKMLPEMQYSPYTSETAKQLAKIISYVPGVRDIGPSADPLASPEVVDNYIKGWTGIGGGWAVKIADAGIRAARGDKANTGPTSVDTPIAEEPILKEFMTRFPSMKTQPIENFYQNLDETRKVQNSAAALNKAGRYDDAARMAAANPAAMLKLNGISSALATGRKAISAIQDNPDVSPVEKRQLVDSVLFQMGSMAKMGNQMMSDFNKQIEQSKGKGE